MSITRIFSSSWARRAAVLLIAASLAGCLDEGGGDGDAGAPPASSAPGTAPQTPPAEPSPPQAPVNNPPEISGTPEPAATAGQPYSFKPQAADADSDFLEFQIANQPGWAQFSEETGELSGTPTDTDASAGETADITITVTDGRDTRSIGPFRIQLKPRNPKPPAVANTPPTIAGVAPGSVIVDQPYLFQPSANDVDGDKLSFAIANRPSWASFSSSTGRLSGTPRTANINTYSNIVISVSDGNSAPVALPAFSIQVRGPDNRQPTISGSPATTVQAGQTYSFQPSASDPDNDTLTYAIANKPIWASFSTSTGRLSGTPTAQQVGNYLSIKITASDGRGGSASLTFAIEVKAAPNSAPTITGSPSTSVDAGAAYSFTPTANDPDRDPLSFTIQNQPAWATFDRLTGRLSGTPTSAQVGTYAGIAISVSDTRASATLAAFSITVNTPANDPPTISGTPPTSVNANAAYNFQPAASDPDGDTLRFIITNAPAWATFNTTNGKLSGTPSAADAGTYANIGISVTDEKETTALPAFTITVAQPTVGNATLSWTPPLENTDGSTLMDLAGFRILYGTSASALNQMITVNNPGTATYVVTGLASGQWHFAVKAYSASGTESDLTPVKSKTIP